MTPSSDGGGGNLNAEHPTAPPPRSSPRLHNFSIPALRWVAQRFLRCKSPVTASTSDRHHHKPQRNHEDETQPSAAVKSPWNLRIRRLRSSGNAPPPPPPQCQAGDMNRSDSAANKSPSPEDKSEEEKGLGKAKFAVELTGEEIEEDFLRMKGSRPQRRPKKRARIVQKKLDKVFRNYDPNLRPQERATEYTRALNAAKLEKIFARPFIGAMDGHIDAVSCMAKNANHLKGIFSGSMDGDIRLWDIATRKTVCQFPGHKGAVRGLAASTDGKVLISCGTDCSVWLWNVPVSKMMGSDEPVGDATEPLAVYVWKHAFWAVDHQWEGSLFATAGAQVDIWDHNRSQPVNSFAWGNDTVISLRFNPGEPDILATSGSDRSITLYDLRMSSPARKLIMRTKTNAISWNPMEPMNFTAANEDCNCYSYDARKLDEAKCVHKDHVSAVMDIDYSPTGREFVTGSYDRTVRIFQYNGGHSREIYHTKRMQRVFCVKFSCDGTYLISGSDDTNLRLWKAKASEQLGVLLPRERKKQEYLDSVKDRYRHLPEVKRIVKHRHLPKPIYKAANLRRTMIEAENKKEAKRRAHSAPGSIKAQPFRKRRIIKEEE